MMLNIKGMEGAVKVSMNTAALENKMSALDVLRSLAQELGKSFMPYVEPCAQIMVQKCMHDNVSSGVRKQATKILSVLMGCCDDHEKMKSLLNLYLSNFATEIN